jgi:hypothetical protein
MEAWQPTLADIWLLIIGFPLLYYAVADGYDLGVGIISLLAACTSRDRTPVETTEKHFSACSYKTVTSLTARLRGFLLF